MNSFFYANSYMNYYARELEKSKVMQTNKELVKQFYNSFKNNNQDFRNF